MGQLRDAQDAQATGSAQLSQEVRALRSAVGDKETALAAIKVPHPPSSALCMLADVAGDEGLGHGVLEQASHLGERCKSGYQATDGVVVSPHVRRRCSAVPPPRRRA